MQAIIRHMIRDIWCIIRYVTDIRLITGEILNGGRSSRNINKVFYFILFFVIEYVSRNSVFMRWWWTKMWTRAMKDRVYAPIHGSYMRHSRKHILEQNFARLSPITLYISKMDIYFYEQISKKNWNVIAMDNVLDIKYLQWWYFKDLYIFINLKQSAISVQHKNRAIFSCIIYF